MGILNNIAGSFPDTITLATTPKEVIFHSCPTTTSCKSVSSLQDAKFNELVSRQNHELAKLDKEENIKTATNKFNASQTKEQREWRSEADEIKYRKERLDLRLREAEINAKIRDFEKKEDSSKEQIKL